MHLNGHGPCCLLGRGFQPFSAVPIALEAASIPTQLRLSSPNDYTAQAAQFETSADAHPAEVVHASDGVVSQ